MATPGGTHDARSAFKLSPMGRGTLRPAHQELLERESEIERLDAVLAEAAAGRGSMLAIAGPAGAGKTALLQAVRARASACGADVRVARATELESEFAFGGARQLLSMAADAGPQDEAARPAVPVLAASTAALEPPPAFAVLDGLTAHLRALAARGTVVALIDDAHWLDAPTVRWLDYLRGRLADLRILIVLTVREAATQHLSTPLHRVLGDARLELWSLAPLSPAAIAALLQARLGFEPHPALVAGCAEATAGNAFAVCELIAALELDGGDPDEIAARLTQRVPATIARSIRGRLARLDPDAVDVARALAVLGDGASLHHVATLSRVSGERAGVMADQLAAAELLTATRPLAFAHPLVRSAVEDDIAPSARAQLHADAADRLAADDGDPEAIAAHLLRTDPAGGLQTVARLRAAADLAIRRGAPDTAVTYLQRANAEPPGAGERVPVLHELGRAELSARTPAGVGRLADALRRADGPVLRAWIGVDLFDGMTFGGRWRDALDLARRLRDDLGDRDPAASLALEMRLALGLLERAPVDDGHELRRIETVGRQVPGGRPLLLLLGLLLALRGERCDEVPALISEGLQGDRFLTEHTADSMLAVHAVDALVFVDALPEAAAVAESLCADARRRGLVLGAVAGSTHRGLVALRAGRLVDGARDLYDALAIARDHELLFTLPFIGGYLAETLVEQGRVGDAAAVIGTVPDAALGFANSAASTLLAARGAVRLAQGRRSEAVADLRACGVRLAEMGARNPNLAPWRSILAQALGPEARDEATALVAEELALARELGLARSIGVALLADARLRPSEAALPVLQEAVAVLQDTPAVLQHARALGDLGTALRRAGRTGEARDRLRAALDGASRCGAAGLAAHLTTELHDAGARPRAPWLTGVEALTPSELRVARLAAGGLTNNEIAAELVITPKTVKHHLGAVYRKLDITTRRELDLGAISGPAVMRGV
jgi:DNA-binding NarL/FixJ family response regulator